MKANLLVILFLAFSVASHAQQAEKTQPRPAVLVPASNATGTHGDVILDDAGGAPFSDVGVLVRPKTLWPSAAVQLGTSSTDSAFKIFNTNGSTITNLLNVYGNGNVAIGGTEAGGYKLSIQNSLQPFALTSGTIGANFIGIKVLDGALWGGAPGSLALSVDGPGVLYAGQLHMGYGNSAMINGLGSLPLEFNAWVPSDINFGQANGPNNFRFISNGYATFVGNVGVGVTSPLARLHVMNTDTITPRGVLLEQISPDAAGAALSARKSRGTPTVRQSIANGDNAFVITPQAYDGTNYMATARMFFTVDGLVATGSIPTAIRFTTGTTAEAERMRITSAGDVLIGTATPTGSRLEVAGNVKISGNGNLEVAGNANFGGTVTGGNIKAKYQDVAEWVPSTDSPAPGTVVVLDPSQPNHVIASSRAYDSAVAGVVSAQPGIVLGDEGASKSLVATTGRVRVRVDASQSPVAIGDLLVTSDKSGVAMKSIPIVFQGVAIHRPGTVVGKALEPLASGQGEILVLLSLQ